jgi:hypothetical protein
MAMGRDCLVFTDRIMLLTPDELNDIQETLKEEKKPFDRSEYRTDVTAYIDFETRLPVAYCLGGEARAYKFSAPPPAMLALPPELQSSKAAQIQQMKDHSRRPSQS